MARLWCIAATLLILPSTVSSQTTPSGSDLYRVACAACHGDDGSGVVPERTFRHPPLNFSDCRVASREPDADWQLVTARGGPAAGLSWDMPSFGESLSPTQIAELVDVLRAFCREPGWPHGNLNAPRALFTAKAFPEDEVVIVPMLSHKSGAYERFRLDQVLEQRVGRRGGIEVGVPLEATGWVRGREYGVGDVLLGAKYVLNADRRGAHIVSAGLEVKLPTGNHTFAFGKGTVTLEPYLAGAARWRGFILQTALAWEHTVHHIPAEDRRHVVYDFYAGRDLAALPGSFTVGVELNGLDAWLALTPQVRKALTRTGALAVAAGVRLPLNTWYEPQYVRWLGYLAWDYRDPIRSRR